MMKGLRSMVSCDDGEVSMTRVVTAATAFIVLGVYVAVNVMSMLKSCCQIVDFPQNSVMVLLVVMGAKVGQSAFENMGKKKEDEQVPPT